MGGAEISTLKLLSGFTDIQHGIGIPGLTSLVLSLNSLQNWATFIPRCPSCGPRGGPGVALPAATQTIIGVVWITFSIAFFNDLEPFDIMVS